MAEIRGECGLREISQATDKFTACQPPCPVCELCGTLEDLRICARCREAWYCSKDHQRSHWPEHKSRCKKCARDNTGQHSTSEPQSTNGTGVGDAKKTNAGTHTVETVSSQETTQHNSKVGITNNKTVKNGGETSDENNVAVENKKADSVAEEAGVGASNPTVTSQETSRVLTDKTQSNTDMTLKKADTGVGNRKGSGTKTGGGISSKKGRGNKQKHRRDSRSSSPTSSMSSEGAAQMTQSRAQVPESEKNISGLSDYVVQCLTDYGICVVDQFLGETKGSIIYDEVLKVREHGSFKDGQLIANLGAQRKVRGDEITWVEKGDPGKENISFLISRLDSLIMDCNSKLQRNEIGGRTKAMVACYPGNGTYYLRHVDNPNGDGRLITCIYYLNRDWDEQKDGGILRIFPDSVKNGLVADIVPKFDRLLFFWSDRRNPHEVQAAYKERFAITVWYFDRAERERALMRYQHSDGADENQSDARTMSTSLVNP